MNRFAPMDGFLREAFTEAQDRLARWHHEDMLGRVRGAAVVSTPKVPFRKAVQRGDSIRLIAEFKRSSPSGGPLSSDLALASRTRAYVEGGAAAVSVLTEARWFGGSIDDLTAARCSVFVPILRKDFIFDEYDLLVSAAAGADAVLLIATAFDAARLAELLLCARYHGMAALVEAHDERDVETACKAGSEIIGVNSRDLRTLKIDLDRAIRVLRDVPDDHVKVLESGIRSRQDMHAAFEAGADAVLVGELLMRSTNAAELIRRLLRAEPDLDSLAPQMRTR